jgi:hypothetical protein
MMNAPLRLGPILSFAIFLAVSYAVATGWTLDLHNADSLIPIFVSLEYWTPFFWGQDRFGMLLPLLAWPIDNSFWNLVAQNALGVFLLLAGAYTVASRCDVHSRVLATLGLLALLLAWPTNAAALQILTTNQSYAPALGLYGIALAATRRQSVTARAAAVLAMILATWTNAGTGLLALAVSTVAIFMPHLRAEAVPLLIGTGLSLSVHLVLQIVAPGTRLDISHITIVGLGDASNAIVTFWSDAYQSFFGPAIWIAVGGALVVVWLERKQQIAREAVVTSLAGALCYGFGMALFFGAESRHATPILPLLLATVIIGLLRHVALRPSFGLILAALLTALVVAQTGVDWPQYGRRRLIDRLAQRHAAELYEAGVSVVTGDYWSAWPYTFAVNMLHERISGTRPVLTVALRGDDLYVRRRSEIVAGTKVAVVPRSDYRYWAVRGPNVTLSVVRSTSDYEVAKVIEQAK